MTPEAPQARGAAACPDAEVLAAYVDGMATPAERSEIERHLVECAECRDVVGGAVALAGSGAPAVTARRSITPLFAIGGAVFAAAAAIFLVVRLMTPSPHYAAELANLAQDGTTRAVEARLTGGFPYGAPPAVMRGGNSEDLARAAVAEQIRGRLAGRTDADADAARGVTYLFSGDPAQAVNALEKAVKGNPESARIQSDLAAAYLERRSPLDTERALEASTRALTMDASLHEARFNRALALERLQRNSEAAAEWREYLARETASPWIAEARRRLARLSGGS